MQMNGKASQLLAFLLIDTKKKTFSKENSVIKSHNLYSSHDGDRQSFTLIKTNFLIAIGFLTADILGCDICWFVDTSVYQLFRGLQESINIYRTTLCHIPEDVYHKYIILIVVFPCMLTIIQLLFQQNAHVFYY
jgi:hypothetical protein